jgi:hypothetical protein
MLTLATTVEIAPELKGVKTAERGQIGRSEGTARHVEVFQTVSRGTLIVGDVDPYPRQRTPTAFTINCEEPANTSAMAIGSRTWQPEVMSRHLPSTNAGSQRSSST